MLPVEFLIHGTEKCPGSNGVLIDAYLRYGRHHGDGCGIYAHSSHPEALFREGDGWALLELEVPPYLKLIGTGRSKNGRYILRAPPDAAEGACCDIVTLRALHLPDGSLPLCLRVC